MDASFLYMETPSAHAHVVGTMVLDPSTSPVAYSFERVVDLILERLHLLAPFRRRLVTVPFQISHPLWIEDPDFDIENHMHRTVVRAPGSMHELAEIVGDIASRPLDRTRPLWELWLVEGLEDGHLAMVTKMHHAAIDGVTGADLMAHLFDLAPDAEPPPAPAQPWQPDTIPGDLELAVDALRHVTGNPARMVKVLRRTVKSVADVVQQRSGPTDPDKPTPAMPFTAPRVRWSGAITPHRVVAFGKATLDDMRLVKSTFGTTVNDVVLAACTMTLRRYLAAHDDLPDQPLVCSVPVSVHGKTDQAGTNQVSTMFVRLPVQLDDPLEVLRTINAETKEAKIMQSAIGADTLQDFAQFIPPTLFNRAMRLYSNLNLADRHRPVHNLIVSNVPGPPIPLFAAGAQVKGVFPFGPLLEGAGLNLTVLSNMGHVDFGVIGCRETVPDVWDIADGFGAAVLELRKLAEQAAGATDDRASEPAAKAAKATTPATPAKRAPARKAPGAAPATKAAAKKAAPPAKKTAKRR
ncbi:MAG: wax ester/triacylglycerol synthase family O-acyltransferase [Acidimicrobiia bacterium]|nr:wax ester/triacylglycerol synthase family O-acyltransferase [Acidimicrobiia bacterium]